ncbi:hypothetical protein C8J57DRAFT_1234498 [Mycena rebaudengoi]|nr:hypothetical protein C8J57DRAFT_1234498 [Mycena rebaudengoi]
MGIPVLFLSPPVHQSRRAIAAAASHPPAAASHPAAAASRPAAAASRPAAAASRPAAAASRPLPLHPAAPQDLTPTASLLLPQVQSGAGGRGGAGRGGAGCGGTGYMGNGWHTEPGLNVEWAHLPACQFPMLIYLRMLSSHHC